MSAPGEEAPVSSELVRSYVINRRPAPAFRRRPLPAHARHLGARPGTAAGCQPGSTRHRELCAGATWPWRSGRALGPAGRVARLLLTDLADQGHLLRRSAPPPAKSESRLVIEKVLHGLQSLYA
ncbi:DUF742 domain-containing protein [Streptomyces sp. T1317-0309]|nr:DUF742 domain-containing protein [Streptomyces sp. T1317-0309]